MGRQVKLCIKELREQRGMTQKELAEKMQVSFQTMLNDAPFLAGHSTTIFSAKFYKLPKYR